MLPHSPPKPVRKKIYCTLLSHHFPPKLSYRPWKLMYIKLPMYLWLIWPCTWWFWYMQSMTWTFGRGLGPGNWDFFGPCENGIEPFGEFHLEPKKVLFMDLPSSKALCIWCFINHWSISNKILVEFLFERLNEGSYLWMKNDFYEIWYTYWALWETKKSKILDLCDFWL